MTVQEFYDYYKKNNIIDYDIKIRGEYFYDSVYFGDDKDYPKAAQQQTMTEKQFG